MKLLSTIAIGTTIIGLSSCATNNIQNRVSQNLDIYSELSPEQQNLVQNGQIQKGMHKKAVFIAWGEPSRAAKGQNQSTHAHPPGVKIYHMRETICTARARGPLSLTKERRLN